MQNRPNLQGKEVIIKSKIVKTEIVIKPGKYIITHSIVAVI
jgi:hypothetical protein